MSREQWRLDGTTVSVVTAADAATVLELTIQPGAGAGAHVHTREDETVVVLDGALIVEDRERHELTEGDAHVLPRGVRHSFTNASDAPTRALFLCTPGGLEHFFRDVAAAQSDADIAAAADRAGIAFDAL